MGGVGGCVVAFFHLPDQKNRPEGRLWNDYSTRCLVNVLANCCSVFSTPKSPFR
ncbi:hypothetical protein LMG33810_000880 [Carnimonas sp. LMG 33810]